MSYNIYDDIIKAVENYFTSKEGITSNSVSIDMICSLLSDRYGKEIITDTIRDMYKNGSLIAASNRKYIDSSIPAVKRPDYLTLDDDD